MQLKKPGSPRFPDEGEVEKEDFRFFVEFLRQYFFLFSFFNNDMRCDRNIPWLFHAHCTVVVIMVAGNLMVLRSLPALRISYALAECNIYISNSQSDE